jgi:hypothetical protein
MIIDYVRGGMNNLFNIKFWIKDVATLALCKGLQGHGPKVSPGATFHAPGSVGKCEGMNPHTPK